VDAASGKTFTYDLVGNMISDGTKTYTWDAENRVTKILYADNSSTEFAYDAKSQRVKTLEKDSAGTITSEKRFIWCGGNQPAEERDSSNTVTIRYFSQGEQVLRSIAPADKLFYAKDHLDSVRELTDSTGALRARYDYDLWGNRTKLSGDLDTVVSFTGHHWHSQSESLETMYRFYRPDLALWSSRDPIGEAGGINLYGYVENYPVNYWDPYGLDPYWQNRELGGSERRSNSNPVSHTFTFTTNPDGSLKDTYSWGNEGNLKGWHKNRPEDRAAAQDALKNPKCLNKQGGADLDPYVEAAYNELNKPENEHQNLLVCRNCKAETTKLNNRAKALQKADK
jgi:RHS repeat-associated protein